MKKFSSTFVSLATLLTILFGLLSGLFTSRITAFAADVSYPKQAMNFAAYTTNRNLNLNGTSLNTQKAAGAVTENWYIEYVSAGVYHIVSASNGKYLSANGTAVTTFGTAQNWQITGVDKDHEGYYLYYKIISASTGAALTYYQGSNSIGLADYTGDGAQKWKLNLYGQEGFSANCMVSQGEKASDIGGLLGQTVTASSADELEKYLDSTDPLTIVISSNIDMQNKGNTRIRDYKTIVGSYSANTIYDSQFRTNDAYGAENDSPSDNIIFRNIDFQAVNKPNRILINVWSSRNIWIDHCSFTSKLSYNKTGDGQDEVGKFIWINTPYESYRDAKDRLRSPDYVTISYCRLNNRYWTVAYGTQNDETTRCRTSLMYNYWEKNVRRCPQIGNGNGHIYNNYYEGNDSGNGSGTSQIIGGDGSNIVSENCRFQSYENTYPYCISAGGGNDPYRDNGSYYAKTSNATPSVIPVSVKVASTWYPNKENYGYSLLDAYNTKGTDTKNFCQTYSGCFKSDSNIKYATDSDIASKYVTTKYDSPFLTDSFDSKYGNMITEFQAAALKEGAVYMFKNVNSGLYMEVDSAKAADGTNVQQWGADVSASHNTWRVLSAGDGYYYIYAQVGDKITYLLDVDSGKKENGTNIGIWSDTKADAQQFKFYQHTDGSYFILTKCSGDQSCVAVSSASAASGASIIQWAVNLEDASQKWTLEQVEDTGCVMDTSKIYQFKNVNSGLFMEVANGAAEDNANVQQWGANSVAAHNSWTLKEFGGGYYYIISQLANGKTYYLNSAGSADGGNIEILTNNKTSSHLFKFVKNPDGTYYILTRTSKDAAAVEIANADKASGANVQQWTVNGNACQKWQAETHAVTTTTTTTTTAKTTTTATTATTKAKTTTNAPNTITTKSTTTKSPDTSTTKSTTTKSPSTTTTQLDTTKTTATTQSTAVSTTTQTDKTTGSNNTTTKSSTTVCTTISSTSLTEAVDPDAILYGDTNLDGKIDLTDAILLNKAVAGAVQLSAQSAANADCDNNGSLDTNDSITLLRFLTQIIPQLPDLS